MSFRRETLSCQILCSSQYSTLPLIFRRVFELLPSFLRRSSSRRNFRVLRSRVGENVNGMSVVVYRMFSIVSLDIVTNVVLWMLSSYYTHLLCFDHNVTRVSQCRQKSVASCRVDLDRTRNWVESGSLLTVNADTLTTIESRIDW